MNKSLDERVLPDGEYIDAMNIRMGSTEQAETGVIENIKGNIPLTELFGPGGVLLSTDARCIGAISNSSNNTIYWFVHDGSFSGTSGGTNKCDMIVSYNILTNTLTYHVVSTADDSPSTTNTTLNFNDKYLITGVNIIEDLMFFTDDYNPPRVINIKRSYPQPNISGVDQITREELLVIKKPPTQAPVISPFKTGGQENYLETRFLSFAYRYKYIDGEYSATSQWSDVAFIPNQFRFSIESMLNDGMLNSCNSVKVTYNSGGKLVVGIDLLFKQSANNIIKIIEKIDKDNMGLSNNTDYTFIFDSSKIFTILPSSELLRLYDNVPLLAKAQTIMGNRLMYGNYVEGYNLVDKDGADLRLDYISEPVTEVIGGLDINTVVTTGNYTIFGSFSAPSIVEIDLSGVDLVEGASISVDITFKHYSFNGGTSPLQQTDFTDIDFLFILPTDYSSVYQLATSPEFIQAIGESLPLGNIKPVYSPVVGALTSCDGNTFTDNVNCSIPNNLDALIKIGSGINAVGEAVKIITSPASTSIGLQLPSMKYVDDLVTPTNTVYESYEITQSVAKYQKIASPKSLHSNRDYEIGIVYMDEYNRSSTALVSPNNSVHIPCAYSSRRNSIRVTIPTTQIAPYWAKKYKFVIKPSQEFYETIYSNIFFRDPNTNEVWFYLEGENEKKVETGDRLIVKSDSSGPTQSCIYATVLDKAAKGANFITPVTGVSVLGGVYMKINPNSFNAIEDVSSTFSPGNLTATALCGGYYEKLSYPVNRYMGPGFDPLNPTWEYEDIAIPAGSKITIKVDWDRKGKNPNKCEHRGYILEKTYTALSDYDNFEDWFNGDNIQATINTGVSKGPSATNLSYIPTIGVLTTFSQSTCYLQFNKNLTTNETVLQFGTGRSCDFGCNQPIVNVDYKKYIVTANIVVYSANNRFIFETEPSDALPDVFFENNLSFDIDNNGNHMGNVTNQNISGGIPAVVDTNFYNCFAFGNGVESYKIMDSISGRHFTLGERVNAVSDQNYKETDRFSDITYSGIYNPETNVNKLNEFNLGLVNYKNLEASFGPIYILDGRQTDVLSLQEDKISYVLAGKNLLSDSASGGAITSVPQVLGTQIARVEKYGISFNPESYVHWGYYRYFTDVKRGAVIRLTGDSSQEDRLEVLSDFDMRTWFRDEFNKSFNTQKLGGYDPYMNEYVLSTNNIKTPYKDDCIQCGQTKTITVDAPSEPEALYEFCVNLGPYVGPVTVSWSNFLSSEDLAYSINYGPSVYSGIIEDPSGSFEFDKNLITEQTAYISFTYNVSFSIVFTVGCVNAGLLNIVQVVIANNSDAGDTTHVDYRYQYGAYISPVQSTPVTLASGVTPPIVSMYNLSTGFEGAPGFPPSNSTIRMQSSKPSPDTFVFNPTNDKFRYVIASSPYPNTILGINQMISDSNELSPIISSGTTHYAEFSYLNLLPPLSPIYIHLIWDYRDSNLVDLCYSPNLISKVCCDCISCEPDTTCITVRVDNQGQSTSCQVFFPYGEAGCGPTSGSFSFNVPAGVAGDICIFNEPNPVLGLWQITSGSPYVSIVACACGSLPIIETEPELIYDGLNIGDEIETNDGIWT